MHRLFLAVPFQSDRILKALQPAIQVLDQYKNELKPVKPSNFHITVQFLGTVSTEKKMLLIQDLGILENVYSKISIAVKGVGFFPHFNKARIIWAGIDGNKLLIQKIYNDVLRVTEKLGYKPDKKSFIPHLTLARVRNNKKLSESCKKELKIFADSLFLETHISEIQLVESYLESKGPRYVVVKNINFL